MRLFHISDLHLGKKLYNYSLLEEQQDMLRQIVRYAGERQPDAVLIAGDIYDRSMPSAEAQELFDDFLTALSDLRPQPEILIIAGNHDSAVRLSYASGFLKRHHIIISALAPAGEEEMLTVVTLRDEYGETDFTLLPFVRPGMLRWLPDGEPADYHEAVKALLDRQKPDLSKRNVILAHQFFKAANADPVLSDSETRWLSVGGLDVIGAELLDAYDYAALGHLHGPQRVGREYVRYSGSPYPYSLSEEHHAKGIVQIELKEKGSVPEISLLKLEPKRKVRSIRGTLSEVMQAAGEEICGDYVGITLTDDELVRPADVLAGRYPHILEIRVDNKTSRGQIPEDEKIGADEDPAEAFAKFYEEMNAVPLTAEERETIEEIIREAGDL